LSLILTSFVLSGCSNDASIDEAQLNAIFDLVRGEKRPSEFHLDTNEIIRNSRAYAGVLSGHLALPKDFDLNSLLGEVYYQWGYFDEALIYLSNAGQGKRTNIKLAANDLLVFSATLGGRSEIIERLDRDTNSMLSKSTLSKLVAGDCKGFEMAVADLTTSSKGNLITRSLQYVEFLSRWVAMNCASNSGYFETQLLIPALGPGRDYENCAT
jgi:hypothetical protein